MSGLYMNGVSGGESLYRNTEHEAIQQTWIWETASPSKTGLMDRQLS